MDKSIVLFLQSEQEDPYAVYHAMRAQAPVHYDAAQRLWGVYTYAHCEAILRYSAAVVPLGSSFFAGLSYEADQIGRHLARISNGLVHDTRRQAAEKLLAGWWPPDVESLLVYLLGNAPREIDWVERVAGVLPSLALLVGLGFSREVAMTVTALLPDVVRIMQPVKTADDVAAINHAVARMLPFVQTHLRQYAIGAGSADEVLYLSNVFGLLIQSHEAGRGLLCNALLQALRQDIRTMPRAALMRFVREVLRFDPPIHHTRRELTADIVLGGVTVPAGETVLLMLASANRDAQYFDDAEVFDAERERAIPYLSFGAGVHRCLAEHFSVDLVAGTLQALFGRYGNVRLVEKDVLYEAKANARLVVRMRVSLEVYAP
jgi:cytochrome P450